MTSLPCPFCGIPSEKHLFQSELAIGIWDAFPASPGHALVVTRRHVADWFAATDPERAALIEGVAAARATIERLHTPDGYNIGMNVGAVAGQTVPHLHLHVIPRYAGDVTDPRGGIRHVIPGAGNYLLPGPIELKGPPHSRALVSGGEDDPLLPHLLAHLADAQAVDIAVAFVMQSGVRMLFEYLQDVLTRGGRVRFLTGDYRDVSEPIALRMLCDLVGDVDIRVFDASRRSFHPKSFIVYHRSGESTAFVGSSNLSRTALHTGIEWNYRVVTASDRLGFGAVAAGFEELFSHSAVQPLTQEWISAYELRRAPNPGPDDAVAFELPSPLPVPHTIQVEALRALEQARSAGAGAGLVVLATGLGKTWLSAFDSARPEFKRVLFVAHRDEILGQALATFRRIRPEATLGYFTGTEKAPEADVLFASIQTLGKQAHLDRFARGAFDYIIVDEFHHAAAPTYRKLIEHFTPRFMLGLTATPERTDGGDLLALCGENVIYRCDLVEGIRRGELCPFDYFGVPDVVDFKNIPWRSGRFDEKELSNALATQARAENALEQYRKRAGDRTIGFCVSQRHADYMAGYFRSSGLRAVAVHAGETSAPRAQSLERLEEGDLDVLFAVDMFNEGVDLPKLDTVMMLRPTESSILWLQQFGRGLRKGKDKRLRVIDYIGNHRSFLVKPRTLLGLEDGDAAVAEALRLIEVGQFELPPGCSVTYDLEATDILKALLRNSPPKERLQSFYEDFRERNGYRPTATETYHSGYQPNSARPSYPSWLSFVRAMGGLTSDQAAAYQLLNDFLDSLEVTPMTKSYKMVVLLAMLAERALPGRISVRVLGERIRGMARRYGVVRTELGAALDDEAALVRLMEENPIAAWAGAKGTGGTQYFTYQNGTFATSFAVPEAIRPAAQELVREIVDWRMAVYARRASGLAGADRFVCKVSHAGGKPLLFLPPRDRTAGIPEGWVDVTVDGEAYQANLVKIAVNVVQRADEDENQLPGILRGWFGPNAGLPGTTHSVEFVRESEGYLMRPADGQIEPSLEAWSRYVRAQVPSLFAFEFKGREAQSGFVRRDGLMLLFVTLDKTTQPEEHQYVDEFISPTEFQWQSQNQHSRASMVGSQISEHAVRGISVHLFVRAQRKLAGKTQPFTYCGPLTFERWEGDMPITVWWKLPEPVPERLWKELRVPSNSSN